MISKLEIARCSRELCGLVGFKAIKTQAEVAMGVLDEAIRVQLIMCIGIFDAFCAFSMYFHEVLMYF